MFALYDISTGLILSYHAEQPTPSAGQAYAKTSVPDDVAIYNCFVQETAWNETESCYYITALKSYKKGE